MYDLGLDAWFAWVSGLQFEWPLIAVTADEMVLLPRAGHARLAVTGRSSWSPNRNQPSR